MAAATVYLYSAHRAVIIAIALLSCLLIGWLTHCYRALSLPLRRLGLKAFMLILPRDMLHYGSNVHQTLQCLDYCAFGMMSYQGQTKNTSCRLHPSSKRWDPRAQTFYIRNVSAPTNRPSSAKFGKVIYNKQTWFQLIDHPTPHQNQSINVLINSGVKATASLSKFLVRHLTTNM